MDICESQMSEVFFTEWNRYTSKVKEVPNVKELEPFQNCYRLTETLSDRVDKNHSHYINHTSSNSSSRKH